MITTEQRKTCSECCGNFGWFVKPDGESYMNKEPGTVWVMCPVCEGSGYEYSLPEG